MKLPARHPQPVKRLYVSFFAPYIVILAALILAACLAWGKNPVLPPQIALALLLGIFLVLLPCSIRFFRRAFLETIRQIGQMEERYSLIVPEECKSDYASMLHFILSAVDRTLNTEYSSQLLRKQAEFDLMKSQINPHFLYNTLDSIRGYALMEKAPFTADMIEILSRIFRYTISQKNELIALEKELNMISDYIKIQECRLNNQILLLQNVQGNDSQLYNHPIPKLILQPFIENAITHGMKDIRSDFVITVDVYTTQSRLIISISDNGCGMNAAKLAELNEKLYANDYGNDGTGLHSKKGSGIAITNVNARIKLLYGDKYGVIAYSTPGAGSEFQIILPCREETT